MNVQPLIWKEPIDITINSPQNDIYYFQYNKIN